MHDEAAISIEQLKTIAMKWFSTDDPKEKRIVYEEYLKTEFGIKYTPEISEINGLWTSASIIIEEYDLGPAPEAPVVESDDEAGCDINEHDIYMAIKEALEENKGKPYPVKIELQLNKDGTGTMNLIDEDGEKTPTSAVYKDGNLTTKLYEEGTDVNFTAYISRSGDSIVLSGDFKIDLNTQAWIKGTWNGTK